MLIMHSPNHKLLSRLLDQHNAGLVLYAQQYCNEPEDVVQDAFIQLFRAKSIPHNVVGWLYRVVRNEAVSRLRSAGRRVKHESIAAGRREPWFKPTSDEQLDAVAATQALTKLPLEQREVVVLRLWSELSFDQIAEVIGKSTSTAHRRYETGLRSLRKNWSVTCPNLKGTQ